LKIELAQDSKKLYNIDMDFKSNNVRPDLKINQPYPLKYNSTLPQSMQSAFQQVQTPQSSMLPFKRRASPIEEEEEIRKR
jgi:hypothetical protein